jgi:hypothetical protein
MPPKESHIISRGTSHWYPQVLLLILQVSPLWVVTTCYNHGAFQTFKKPSARRHQTADPHGSPRPVLDHRILLQGLWKGDGILQRLPDRHLLWALIHWGNIFAPPNMPSTDVLGSVWKKWHLYLFSNKFMHLSNFIQFLLVVLRGSARALRP